MNIISIAAKDQMELRNSNLNDLIRACLGTLLAKQELKTPVVYNKDGSLTYSVVPNSIDFTA